MCGGFTCSKNSLIALNFFYVVVSVVLIFVAAYANVSSIVTSISLVSGIIICAVFLLLLSIFGIIATTKHHQVMLFFYMIILFILFIIQFSVACACLAFNEDQQNAVIKQGWKVSQDSIKMDAQHYFGCCGYNNVSLPENDTLSHPSCDTIVTTSGIPCCDNATISSHMCCNENSTVPCHCPLCAPLLQDAVEHGLSLVGGIGLFFSFTEIVGIVITARYRHQMDPRVNLQSLLS